MSLSPAQTLQEHVRELERECRSHGGVRVSHASGTITLRFDRSATFAIEVPAQYPEKPPVVRHTAGALPACFPARAVQGDKTVALAVLSAHDSGWSSSYTLAVVYHAVLRLMQKRPAAPWDATEPALGGLSASGPSGAAAGVRLAAGHAESIGRRRAMEDATFILESLDVPEAGIRGACVCGIFDGHGGDRCAKWSAEAVPKKLVDHLRSGLPWREALFRAFVDADDEWLELGGGGGGGGYNFGGGGGGGRGGRGGGADGSGCTALVAAHDGRRTVYVASLGDCRAVLKRGDGSTVALSVDCKADDPSEVARVVAAGGFVLNKRVNGQLAVSRALGDRQYKVPARVVLAEPRVSQVELRPDDRFLALACDGVWDVLSTEEAGAFAATHDQPERGEAPTAAASALVQHAIHDRGSTDNVSVIVARVCPAAGGPGAGERRQPSQHDAYRAPLAPNHRADRAFPRPDAGNKSRPMPAAGARAAKEDKPKDDMDFLLDDSNW